MPLCRTAWWSVIVPVLDDASLTDDSLLFTLQTYYKGAPYERLHLSMLIALFPVTPHGSFSYGKHIYGQALDF